MTDLEEMVNSYLETALWSSTDGDEPLDNKYSQEDIYDDDVITAKSDCACFVAMAEELLDDLDEGQLGHDFWLTRNGHGAGFWDGDYEEELGKKLTELSKKFTEVEPYVGDDNKIYFSGGGLK